MGRVFENSTLGLLLLAATACGTTTEFTETNAPSQPVSSRSPDQVEVFTTKIPDRPYQEIGIIVVRQASTTSLAGQNEILADLRAQAAERGCHGIIITGDANQVVGHVSNGSGQVSTVQGKRATCILFTDGSDGRQSEKEEASTSEFAPDAEFPEEALGFQFGMSEAEAEVACKEASHSWKVGQSSSRCSGTPTDVGLALQANLKFCADQLCGLIVTTEIAESDLSTFLKIWQSILARYGKPKSSDTAVPPGCEKDLYPCVERGEARFGGRWVWDDDSRIDVEMRLKDESPRLQVTYIRKLAQDSTSDESPASSAF